ncbi:MAG: hypothetical protein JSS91_00750 [Bacteroidetes bacterium]|nr:hypothetical protein [Bacteroidota bacterium]
MQITWKDINQGGAIEDKDILIEHSEFYSETTTVNKLKSEKERLSKLITDSQDRLANTSGKLQEVIDILNIE